MLKNELEILAIYVNPQRMGHGVAKQKVKSDFSKLVSESCGRAREAWAAAAFSDDGNDSIRRYFDFHFKFLSGLLSERSDEQPCGAGLELYRLMDHLLCYYSAFIQPQQPVVKEYADYRLKCLQPKYLQFISQLEKLNGDASLQRCLIDSLSPIYCSAPVESIDLSALFYLEELLTAIAARRNNLELMSSERLVSALMAFNFNHFLFLDYLRNKVISEIQKLLVIDRDKYLVGLIAEIPVIKDDKMHGFDLKWPHITILYRSWLNDHRILFTLTQSALGTNAPFTKIPLNISVKHLACTIRALYESGYYGNVSLTAIFDHAAAVFTTKRQQQISPDSLSNAYYEVNYAAAIKMSRMFGNAIDFLKPCCFPG